MGVTQRTGRSGYYVTWTDGRGRRRRKRMHGTRADARRAERDLKVQADRERLRLPDDAPRDEPTLEELAAAWREHVVATRRPLTWDAYDRGLRQVFAFLDARGCPLERVADVCAEDLTAFVAARREAGSSAATINRRVGAVVRLLNWGVEQGRLGANPLKGKWRPLDEVQRRPRRALTEMEIARLLLHSPAELADVWRFFLGTGLRDGELSSLGWPDVEWDQHEITVRGETSKGNRDRIIPLRPDLVAVLRRQRVRRAQRIATAHRRVTTCERRLAEAESDEARESSTRRLEAARRAVETAGELVFTNTGGGHWGRSLSRRLKPCLRAAGLDKGLDVHTLRHTFGSHLIRAGINPKTVQMLLGHSSLKVTLDCYTHEVEEADRREAVLTLPLPGAEVLANAAPLPRPAAEAR